MKLIEYLSLLSYTTEIFDEITKDETIRDEKTVMDPYALQSTKVRGRGEATDNTYIHINLFRYNKERKRRLKRHILLVIGKCNSPIL